MRRALILEFQNIFKTSTHQGYKFGNQLFSPEFADPKPAFKEKIYFNLSFTLLHCRIEYRMWSSLNLIDIMAKKISL